MTDIDGTRADIVLLERIVARESDALAELYDRYSRLLFGLILRMLKDRGEAEEVLQEVFVQAWTRAETYSVALGSPAGWLVGIARNRAIDRLRAIAVRARGADAVSAPAPVRTPEVDAWLGERQRVIRQALDALPPDQRDLIDAAYFGGLTHSELAVRFGLPLGTVKTRVRSGLLTLRGLLQRIAIEQ